MALVIVSAPRLLPILEGAENLATPQHLSMYSSLLREHLLLERDRNIIYIYTERYRYRYR